MTLECPKCGCQSLSLVGAGERGGRPWARYACSFCSSPSGAATEFYVGSPPPVQSVASASVPFIKTACPHCRSTNNTIEGTQRGDRVTRRQHKCRSCGRPFNSYDTHAASV